MYVFIRDFRAFCWVAFGWCWSGSQGWHRAHTPIWEKSPGEQCKSTERMKKVLYSMIEVGRPWESEVCTSPEQGVS